MKSKENAAEERSAYSRRDFLKGGAVLGAMAVGATALAGCAPAGSGSAGGAVSADAASAASSLPDAEPIAPVDVPDAWSAEYDVVVVGTGGGGLAAALHAAENGLSVVAIEKSSTFGGATKHASGWLNIAGNSRKQNEMGYGYPVFPVDIKEFTKKVLNDEYDHSVDPRLIMKLGGKGGEVADWMEDYGIEWTCAGAFVVPTYCLDGTQDSVLGMQPACETIYNAGVKAGAEFLFDTACEGLVFDGDRVVGVKARGGDKELFLKGAKGVILCSGGFGMNYDMLQKYIPTGYDGMVCGGPVLTHTGECTRMALGLGADMAGYDSWCMWESMPDNDTKEFNFFYGGEVQLCRNPWLNIDRDGRRYDYANSRTWPASEGGPNLIGGTGDWAVVERVMSLPGRRSYTIFDSNFKENIFKLGQTALRKPIVPEDPLNPEADGIISHNWLDDIEPAIEDGMIKRADTIEELAEQLGLEPDVLTAAVKNWNRMCDQGEDDELLYPYPPEWLNRLENPPYYGAKIGGHFGKTLCGVRVNDSLQVIDTKGHVISGLYANYTTAGGICGEGSWGGGAHFNTSILGGNALSWVSGYVACEGLMENE